MMCDTFFFKYPKYGLVHASGVHLKIDFPVLVERVKRSNVAPPFSFQNFTHFKKSYTNNTYLNI